MIDQAEGLRELVTNKSKQMTATKLLTVVSGKGGVGKSSLVVNLALALKDLKKNVLVIDGDIGLYNLNVLLGIKSTDDFDFNKILTAEISWEKAVQKLPMGLHFLGGGNNSLDVEEIDVSFIHDIKANNIYDYIVIDTGAGINYWGFQFQELSDYTLVVTTPELPSITDTYALVKSIVNNHNRENNYLVVNRCEKESEAFGTWKKVDTVLDKFLNTNIQLLGYIFEDKHMLESIKKQSPSLLLKPYSPSGIGIRSIARRLELL